MKNRMAWSGLVALLMGVGGVSAASYYVSPSGDDGNDGMSEATAWRTLAPVRERTFAAGDVIHLQAGGEWREGLNFGGSGTTANPILVTRYGDGEDPIISGADVLTGWIEVAPGIFKVPLDVITYTVVLDRDRRLVRRTGLSEPTQLRNHEFWRSTENELFIRVDEGNPDALGWLVEVAVRNHPVGSGTSSNVILERLHIRVSNGANIRVDPADAWTIRDCRLAYGNSGNNSAGAGVHFSGSNNSAVLRCEIIGAAGDGIMGWSSKNLVISGNTIHTVWKGINTGGDNIQISGGSHGASNGYTITDNWVTQEGTDTPKGCIIAEKADNGYVARNTALYGQFGIEVNGSNIVVEHNYTAHQGWERDAGTYPAGLYMSEKDSFSDVVFRYNVVYNSRWNGINIAATNGSGTGTNRVNFRFYNNTIVDCLYGLRLTTPASGIFQNNIVWNVAQMGTAIIFGSGLPGETWTSTNNLFSTGARFSSGGVEYGSLSAYQAGTGREMNSLSGAAEFVNVLDGDLRLTEGSPAFGAGVHAGPDQIPSDLFGMQVDLDSITLGAIEGVHEAEVGQTGLLAYEDFDYLDGQALEDRDGGIGFGGPWSRPLEDGSAVINTPGLSVAGLSTGGNRLRIQGNSNGPSAVQRPLGFTAGDEPGTLWLAFIGRKVGSSWEGSIRFGNLAFRAPSSGEWRYEIGSQVGSIPGTVAAGGAHLFVARVDRSSANRGYVTIWVDPDLAAGEPDPATARVSTTGTVSMSTLGISHSSVTSTSIFWSEWDAVRIGYAYEDVISGTIGALPPNTAPIADFTPSAQVITLGSELILDASGSTDAEGEIAAFDWDFGDGASGSGPLVQHTYASVGTYTVTVRVRDAVGAESSASGDIRVHSPPVAFVSATPVVAALGELVTFNGADSSDPDGSIAQYQWTFSDGSTAEGAVVERTFAEPGEITAILTVVDDDGAIATESVLVRILAPTGGLLAYDGFDETSATSLHDLNTGSGWDGPWTATQSYSQVASPGMSAPGVEATGNRIRLRGEARRSLANPYHAEAGTVWIGFLLRSSNSSRTARFSLVDNGNTVLSVTHTPGQKMGLSGVAATADSTSAARFALLRVNVQPEGNVAYLWVDPDLSSQPDISTAAAVATFPTRWGIDEIILNHTSTSSHESAFDEIRIATSFEDAVSGTVAGAVETKPLVTLVRSGSQASEFGPVPSEFRVTRSGSVASALVVGLAWSGTATGGSDYEALPSEVEIPIGNAFVNLSVEPISDTVAEGMEQIVGTIVPRSEYLVSESGAATVTLADLPFDHWRFMALGSEANSPSVGGEQADPNGTGRSNLLNYALGYEINDSGNSTLMQAGARIVDGREVPTLEIKSTPPREDLDYVPEVSSNLQTWSDASEDVEIFYDDLSGQLVISDLRDGLIGRRFLRLRVERRVYPAP